MSQQEHEEFLQKICEEVDKITEQYLPDDLSPEDVEINVRLLTGKNPLGESIRLLGNSIFVRLHSIKFDTPPVTPGQRSLHRSDKFLGRDTSWVNLEHISSLYPGKDIDIEGRQTKTCFVCIMEETVYRITGTCEEFFDSIHTPLMCYATESHAAPPLSQEDKSQGRTENDALLSNV